MEKIFGNNDNGPELILANSDCDWNLRRQAMVEDITGICCLWTL